MKVKKKCLFLFSLFIPFIFGGCGTTPPTIGYIPPSKDIIEAYINNRRDNNKVPFDGVYLDFGKDGGRSTNRAVWLTNVRGEVLNQPPLENRGTDIVGRITSNVGVPIGFGTLLSSPFWGYFGQKAREADKTNMNMSSESSSSSFAETKP